MWSVNRPVAPSVVGGPSTISYAGLSIARRPWCSPTAPSTVSITPGPTPGDRPTAEEDDGQRPGVVDQRQLERRRATQWLDLDRTDLAGDAGRAPGGRHSRSRSRRPPCWSAAAPGGTDGRMSRSAPGTAVRSWTGRWAMPSASGATSGRLASRLPIRYGNERHGAVRQARRAPWPACSPSCRARGGASTAGRPVAG